MINSAPHGVRVDAVLPVAVDTETTQYDAQYVNAAPEQFAQRIAEICPIGRVADPAADIAPIVLFLVSDDARYLTGVQLPVDGGFSAGSVNTA